MIESVVVTKNYGLIESIEQLSRFIDKLISDGAVVSVDIETGYKGPAKEAASLRPDDPVSMIVGISFTNSLDWARYVPLAHDLGNNLDNRSCAELFWKLFRAVPIIAFNAAFEARFFRKWFKKYLSDYSDVIASDGYFTFHSDPMIECYVHQNLPQYGLKFVTEALFEHKQADLLSLFPTLPKNKAKTLRFNSLTLDPHVVAYGCEDSVWALAAHQFYWPRVKDRFIYKTEMQVMPIVCRMEDVGVKYDFAAMERDCERAEQFLEKYNAEIQLELSRLCGRPILINLNSPTQLRAVLFGELGLKGAKLTETGLESTGAIAMEALSKKYPVVRKILDYKEIKTLITKFLDKYPKNYQYAPDGHTHPNHLQCFVITGRFSVSSPNYQQCLPGNYEVLTPDGWVKLAELQNDVEIAQFVAGEYSKADDRFEFVIPEAVIDYEYDGPMVKLSGADELAGKLNGGNKGHSGVWFYTPNHDLVYRKRQSSGARDLGFIEKISARDYAIRLRGRPMTVNGQIQSDWYIPKAARISGGRRLNATERLSLRRAIACQADGKLLGSEQLNKDSRRYSVRVYKQRKCIALENLVEETKIFDQDTREELPRIGLEGTILYAEVSEWLDESKEKNFIPSAILSLCWEDLEWFVSEVMKWDGDSVRGMTFKQMLPRALSVDIVQAACVLSGSPTSIYYNHDQPAVTLNVSYRSPYKGTGYQKVELVSGAETLQDGKVYCVTVSSGMFLVRNQDKLPQVTGNSGKGFNVTLPSEETETLVSHYYQLESNEYFHVNFRNYVVAPDEHYIIGFDYSQIELRVLAGEAGEQYLISAFNNNEDIHKAAASLIFHIPIEEVDKKQRDKAKTVQFALLYGMGVKSLADRLALTKDEAQALYDKYFSSFSSVAAFVDKCVALAITKGYSESRFGRHHRIWDFLSRDAWIYSRGERLAVNAVVQGTAADILKVTMVRCDSALKKAGLQDRVKMVMTIHDALEFYVHESVSPQEVISVLYPAAVYDIAGYPRLKADWHYGYAWGSVEEIDVNEHGQVIGELKPIARPAKGIAKSATHKMADLMSDILDLVSRKLVVELQEMPDKESYLQFVKMLKASAGPNVVQVKTPQGVINLNVTTGMTPANQLSVACILPGAVLSWDETEGCV